MKKLSTVALLCVFASNVPHLTGSQRLAIRVTPAIALAPAAVTIRATVEPSDDNRLLTIQVDSPNYHRVSEIPLDGKNSQRLNIFEMKGLPIGLYEVGPCWLPAVRLQTEPAGQGPAVARETY